MIRTTSTAVHLEGILFPNFNKLAANPRIEQYVKSSKNMSLQLIHLPETKDLHRSCWLVRKSGTISFRA